MSTPIEASSLSSLTGLFTNPPQYPRNPTHQTHEPLVLYIVRVPGSKDVFLTPLKPPTKASISLEAIQTCLYYLHVETPEDDTIRQSFEIERQLEQQKSSVPPVLRKPLPPTPFANYPASQRPPTPPKSYPHYQPGGTGNVNQVDRYMSRGSHLRLNLARANSVPKKPLGARPLPSQIPNDDSVSSSQASQDPAIDNKDLRRRSVPGRNPAPWVPRLQVPDGGALSQISENETATTGDASSIPARAESPDVVTGQLH